MTNDECTMFTGLRNNLVEDLDSTLTTSIPMRSSTCSLDKPMTSSAEWDKVSLLAMEGFECSPLVLVLDKLEPDEKGNEDSNDRGKDNKCSRTHY